MGTERGFSNPLGLTVDLGKAVLNGSACGPAAADRDVRAPSGEKPHGFAQAIESISMVVPLAASKDRLRAEMCPLQTSASGWIATFWILLLPGGPITGTACRHPALFGLLHRPSGHERHRN